MRIQTGLMALSCLALASCASSPAPMPATELSGRILIASDSTAANYPAERRPQTGWGQVIGYYLTDTVSIDNRAVNGRSSKSYIDEGLWGGLLDAVEPGDLVLIAFGHNDSRDDAPERYGAPDGAYRDNLMRFAEDVRRAGGVPVLLSSPARRLWEGPAMVETHGLYRLNAGIAAQETDTAFIDLSQASMDYFETLGKDETKQDYLWLSKAQANTRFPEGVEDNTHFTELGACGVARVIAKELPVALPATVSLINPDRFDDSAHDTAGRPADVVDCAIHAWD